MFFSPLTDPSVGATSRSRSYRKQELAPTEDMKKNWDPSDVKIKTAFVIVRISRGGFDLKAKKSSLFDYSFFLLSMAARTLSGVIGKALIVTPMALAIAVAYAWAALMAIDIPASLAP